MGRRTFWSACGAVASIALAASPADARVLDVLRRLDARHVNPAPLVPTTAPARFRPIESTLQLNPAPRDAYALRLAHYTPAGPDAIIALSGGDYKSLRAARRDFRGYRTRGTRVRGKRGFVSARRNEDRYLVWSEGGRVYSLGTGTGDKVSVAQMRSVAAGLQPLGHYYIGGSADPNKSSTAEVATTARTVTVYLEFNADCTFTPHAGQAAVVFAPLHGNSFSFDVAQNRVGSAPWTGSVSGTVEAGAATVQYQVSGTIDGESCSGSETITAPRG